jgi:hypothetical protein
MTKHTPGPWKKSNCGNDILIGLRNDKWNPDAMGLVVAKTIGNSEMCQANANLLALSPDLLQDCRDALLFIADETLRSRIQSDIDKAEGKE